ncbi:MAG: hypothetical protein R3A44_22850 [Caldilineaceae bacterium]
MNRNEIQSTGPAADLAGSLPLFPPQPGAASDGGVLGNALRLPDFGQKYLVFNRIGAPGQIHVYRADCRAGDRLRAQIFAPVLPMGGSISPRFAIVAQSLPYSADVHQLPFELPAGFSAVVAPEYRKRLAPVTDLLTRVNYSPGPVVDTRTLVGGRCYVVVWSPQNQMGKYVLQTGHRWPFRLGYWAQIPRFWWQIRGWFGQSRAVAYVALAGLLLATFWLLLRNRER